MRIFYLTTEFLWPPHHGGRVRSLMQLSLLASLPEVTQLTVMGLCETPVSAQEIEKLRAQLLGGGGEAIAARASLQLELLPPIFHPIHLRKAPLALLQVAARRAYTGQPYLAAKWESAPAREALTQALRSPTVGAAGYDLIYIDHLGMAQYLPLIRSLCPGARVVLEEHNVESDFFAQFAQRAPLPLRFLARQEYKVAARFEAQTLAAVDAVVAISQVDAQALAALVTAHTGQQRTPVVVPQVVQSTEPKRKPQPEHNLCYVGNLTWHPNTLGLSWFCQKVWPLVRRALPSVKLTIAGSGLGKDGSGRLQVPSDWQVPGIEVVGYVEDLETLYTQSLGMVAPILGGSGVRIKLLEALRAGMPVVTTRAGAAGLPLHDGAEVLIEDEPEAFARAVIRLCLDAGLQEQLRNAGYQYLRQGHSLKAAAVAMRQALGLPTQ